MIFKKKTSQAQDVRMLALDLVPTPVMAVDREFRVLFMNKTGAQVVGRSQAECVGARCSELFKTVHCNTPECRVAQAMQRQDTFTADQVASPQGKPIPIRYTASPLRDASGQVMGAVEFVVDITQESQMLAGMAGLVETASEGKLDARIETEGLKDNYRQIADGVNSMLDAILSPVQEAAATLERVANRDLTARVQGNYQGDHAKIKDSLNQAVANLDDGLQQVTDAVGQVTAASSQIGNGSQALAQGASEQASSLEEVSSSLQELASMTRQNAGNAKQARGMAEGTRDGANRGLESMNRLSGAMEKIKASSDSTAKIVKTIDEIAFQTNLLALNAAVEAARAGDAGKGFAVVAEEVRNLAMRSAEAAKNTANLIEESVRNAESGVALNAEVLERLQEITTQANKVGEVMNEIAAASDQQTEGIDQITTAVEQMNQVTQQNAAGSEESASAAEELSAQAQELNALVGHFRLTKVGSAPVARAHVTLATGTDGAPVGTPRVARPALQRPKLAVLRGPSARSKPDPESVIPLRDDNDEDVLKSF